MGEGGAIIARLFGALLRERSTLHRRAALEFEAGGGGRIGLEKAAHVMTGPAVPRLGLGGAAVGRRDYFILTHVGVVGGEEDADVGGEAGEDESARAEGGDHRGAYELTREALAVN